MIAGAHVLFYSIDPEADRAFFRDVLQFASVDVGGGWLIFALPPSEAALHPSEGEFVHVHAGHRLLGAVVYLMCDDVRATVTRLDIGARGGSLAGRGDDARARADRGAARRNVEDGPMRRVGRAPDARLVGDPHHRRDDHEGSGARDVPRAGEADRLPNRRRPVGSHVWRCRDRQGPFDVHDWRADRDDDCAAIHRLLHPPQRPVAGGGVACNAAHAVNPRSAAGGGATHNVRRRRGERRSTLT